MIVSNITKTDQSMSSLRSVLPIHLSMARPSNVMKEKEGDRTHIDATSVNTAINTYECFPHLMAGQQADFKETWTHSQCDQRTLNTLKKQLEIHERLHSKYVSGEIPKDNALCQRLDGMKETRKTMLQHLYIKK